MITKNDCLLLLGELSDNGVDTNEMCNRLINNPDIDLSVLEFIHKYRPLEVLQFYINIRKNYNNKKSKLYKEIVQIDTKEPKDITITLSSLLTQILLFSNKVEDKQLFLKHSRAEEISKVLNNYFKTYDVQMCFKLLSYVKADLKALESINLT